MHDTEHDTLTVTITVQVHDKRAAIKAARDNARAQSIRPGVISDWRDAAQWLLDPGSLPGFTILESGIQ